MLNCIDNSGATLVECVANLRMKRHGRVGMVIMSYPTLSVMLTNITGDRIIVVVQKSRSMGDGGPGSTSAAAANKVRRGDIRHAIIVRTAKKVQRKDGMVVRFDDNACALIGKNGEPLGTRINGELSTFVGNQIMLDTDVSYRGGWCRAAEQAAIEDPVAGVYACIMESMRAEYVPIETV